MKITKKSIGTHLLTGLICWSLSIATGLSGETSNTAFSQYLLDAEGNPVSKLELKDKHVAIYFAAAWSASCQEFTPRLLAYQQHFEDDLEVVIVSSDFTKDLHLRHMDTLDRDCYTVPWGSSAARALTQKYKIRTLPTVVILKPNGEVASWNGVKEINDKVHVRTLGHENLHVNMQWEEQRVQAGYYETDTVFSR